MLCTGSFFNNHNRRREKMDAQHEKEMIISRQPTVFGEAKYVSKDEFLLRAWKAISSVISNNRNSKLVQAANKRYNNHLTPRLYTIIVILHGTHTCECNIMDLVNDVVSLLDKDLDKEEQRALEYSKSSGHYPFFIGLHSLWQKVSALYENIDNVYAFPPTAHLGFALLTLNCGNIIGKPVQSEDLVRELTALNKKMEVIHTEAYRSQHQTQVH